MSYDVHLLPALTDNYTFVVHHRESNQTVVVDPAEAGPVHSYLLKQGWKLDFILNTHHHPDHTAANLQLKSLYTCQIRCSFEDKSRVPGADHGFSGEQSFLLGDDTVEILATPGHTLGHICYHFPSAKMLFCGDVLFSMGCGRVFEGTFTQAWESLNLLRELPDETLVFCTHEYTLANSRFALEIEPENSELKKHVEYCQQLRALGRPTIPTTIGIEKLTNPFFRCYEPSVRAYFDNSSQPGLETFTLLRRFRDDF